MQMDPAIKGIKIEVTDFALRHWEKDFTGTRITSHNVDEFLDDLICELHSIGVDSCPPADGVTILDGYANFCKLVIVPNFTNARTGTLPITLENYHYLRTGYHSRRKEELPVLARWFDLPLPAPEAKYLVVVVYSREQLLKEKYAELKKIEEREPSVSYMFDEDSYLDGADWGIVAILGQMEDEEEPMKPATMIRNALGIEEGGSGVAIDREKYMEAVEFWKTHATVKS